MRHTGLAVSTAISLLLASSTALAADWYVDQSAPAGGDGSQAKPFQTINASLAGLSRGDTVWVASGTYDEVVNVTKLTGTGTTTFRAVAGAVPIIDGTSGSSAAGFVVQTDVPNVTFQDLTIQNAVNGALGIQFYYADGGQVIHCTTRGMSSNAVTFYYSNQGTVRGCTCQGNIGGRKTTGTVVEDNEVYGASAEGIGLYDGSTACTVAHNVIHDNFSVNVYLDSISHSLFDGNLIYETDPGNDLEGIEISDEGHYSDLAAPVNSYNTIINNVVVGHNLGIVFWYSDEWPTQALNDESGLRYDVISNNTLIDNKGSFKWDASPAHVGTTIQNNVVYAAMGSSPIYLLQAKSANGISLDHNLWFAPDLSQAFLWLGNQVDHAGFVTASGQGSADVLSDPEIVAPSTIPPATNAEVMKGSPVIGAGATLAPVATDFLGAPRPATGTDIGAFQYGATVPADGGVVGPPGDAGSGSGSGSGSGGASATSGTGGESAGEGGASAHTPTSKGGCGCEVVDSAPAMPGVGALVLLGLTSRRKRSCGAARVSKRTRAARVSKRT
jgi:MYXO-CTERM domain-containing protein